MPLPEHPPEVSVLARRLEVSREAVELLRAFPTIDLHLDSFIPSRLWGYDLLRRHGPGLFRGRFFGQLDFVRALEAGLAGGGWSITTNPLPSARIRWRSFLRNLADFRRLVQRAGPRLRVVRNHSEWLVARRDGVHAVMLAIQGGNALQAAPNGPASIPEGLITRVTLVHLTNSIYGATSSPLALWGRKRGLSREGARCIEALNAERIFVDLAHINREGFREAVAVHDRDQPLLVTHTGVCGVTPHWRNLDDEQLRAVADTDGCVGIIFAQPFLRRAGGPRDAGMILEHMEHVIKTVGERHVALGSDYDGAILPPAELRDGASYPRLVDAMLRRGWEPERIGRILGGNFLRAFARLRP